MAQNLALFTFNNRANTAFSITGWYVDTDIAVNTLPGNDNISGIGGTSDSNSYVNNVGIYNAGTINTGTGNDTITGVTTNNGVGIYSTFGTTNTGSGNDTITGIRTGSGISSTDTLLFNIGIFNDEFTIDTGTGNDIISGTGNDIIIGMSTGAGNDTLIGFGAGNFHGGNGIDKILFSEGIYVISGSTINSGGASMNASQFEQIGGVNGGVFGYVIGIVTVNADGVASFA
ncbi:MAG: hypothetical protein NTY67_15200 [Cyanobacteria bacterium]|nr:hypothetical protein [Cyanobacteriota bacterium]